MSRTLQPPITKKTPVSNTNTKITKFSTLPVILFSNIKILGVGVYKTIDELTMNHNFYSEHVLHIHVQSVSSDPLYEILSADLYILSEVSDFFIRASDIFVRASDNFIRDLGCSDIRDQHSVFNNSRSIIDG